MGDSRFPDPRKQELRPVREGLARSSTPRKVIIIVSRRFRLRKRGSVLTSDGWLNKVD